jgi:hypothetical protein
MLITLWPSLPLRVRHSKRSSMGRFFFVDVPASGLQSHELRCNPSGESKDTVGQPRLTFGLEEGGEGVIASTAFNQIPIGSEQLLIRQVDLLRKGYCWRMGRSLGGRDWRSGFEGAAPSQRSSCRSTRPHAEMSRPTGCHPKAERSHCQCLERSTQEELPRPARVKGGNGFATVPQREQAFSRQSDTNVNNPLSSHNRERDFESLSHASCARVAHLNGCT